MNSPLDPREAIVASSLKSEEQELLKTMVSEQSDIYLRELQAAIKERKAIEVSLSSLSRTLKRLKLNRKKNFSRE